MGRVVVGVVAPRPEYHCDLLEALRSQESDPLFAGVKLQAALSDAQQILPDLASVRHELGLNVNEAAALSLRPGRKCMFVPPRIEGRNKRMAMLSC